MTKKKKKKKKNDKSVLGFVSVYSTHSKKVFPIVYLKERKRNN